MKESEIINSIKETEAKSASMLKAAKEETGKLILNAKLKAKELLGYEEIEAHNKALKLIESFRQELEKSQKDKLIDLDAEKERLERLARANSRKAVEFVVKRFFEKWRLPNLKK